MTSESTSCPACRSPMVRENFGTVFVDVCADGCRGTWFDGGELARLDHDRKGGGPALQRALESAPPEQVPAVARPLQCPRCDVEMDVLEYELQVEVVIDSCPECTGVFLDAGELRAIRSRELTKGEPSPAHAKWRRRRGKHRRRREEEQRVRALRVVTCMTWMPYF